MEARSNYLIDPVKQIGSGGYGIVEEIRLYNAVQHLCGLYARKILTPDPSDPDLIERFRREIKCQCKCLHPNVVQIFICQLQVARPWFVMELAEANLHDELEQGSLTEKEKIGILKMVLDGLAYIHSKGYLHRDIKPMNILKFSNGIYKLSDFGLAKSLNPTNTQFVTKIGVFLGTPKYFDYGVVMNGYSHQSDIYSIGVLMEDLNVDGYDDIINKCKHRQLNKRYLNVEQIIHAVNAVEAKL